MATELSKIREGLLLIGGMQLGGLTLILNGAISF
jgi:hypothetical protein